MHRDDAENRIAAQRIDIVQMLVSPVTARLPRRYDNLSRSGKGMCHPRPGGWFWLRGQVLGTMLPMSFPAAPGVKQIGEPVIAEAA